MRPANEGLTAPASSSVTKKEQVSLHRYGRCTFTTTQGSASNGILCAPSASGKTVLLVSMILEQHRGCFERVYVMSNSIDMDPQWEPVKEYIRKDLGVNTDREQCWWDEWDEGALRQILAQQKKITQQPKQLGMKKTLSSFDCPG